MPKHSGQLNGNLRLPNSSEPLKMQTLWGRGAHLRNLTGIMVLIRNGCSPDIELETYASTNDKQSPYNFRFANKKLKKALRKNKKRKRKIKAPQTYQEYIDSSLWERRKGQYYAKFPKQCSVCGTRRSIDLHHIVYTIRGSEPDQHLTPVCRKHHKAFHARYGAKGNMKREWQLFLGFHQQQSRQVSH